jgi:hypothetical protein
MLTGVVVVVVVVVVVTVQYGVICNRSLRMIVYGSCNCVRVKNGHGACAGIPNEETDLVQNPENGLTQSPAINEGHAHVAPSIIEGHSGIVSYVILMEQGNKFNMVIGHGEESYQITLR